MSIDKYRPSSGFDKNWVPKAELPSQLLTARSTNKQGAGALRCPHCFVETISPIRKLLLGPLFSSVCSVCHLRWRISKWSLVVAVSTAISVPFAFGFAVVIHLVSLTPSGFMTTVIATFAIAAMVMVYLVPVRKS